MRTLRHTHIHLLRLLEFPIPHSRTSQHRPSYTRLTQCYTLHLIHTRSTLLSIRFIPFFHSIHSPLQIASLRGGVGIVILRSATHPHPGLIETNRHVRIESLQHIGTAIRPAPENGRTPHRLRQRCHPRRNHDGVFQIRLQRVEQRRRKGLKTRRVRDGEHDVRSVDFVEGRRRRVWISIFLRNRKGEGTIPPRDDFGEVERGDGILESGYLGKVECSRGLVDTIICCSPSVPIRIRIVRSLFLHLQIEVGKVQCNMRSMTHE
mmetsp:Transcript_41056/g.86125  ORF Transcript_41056/g.86125 Transcript_41056/m.86125 type:complete len:263 (+) Transcript_41056:1233-2021(+)